MKEKTRNNDGEPEEAEDKIITAEELMKNHIEETPKTETGFTLAGLKSKSQEPVPVTTVSPGTVSIGKPNDDVFVRTSQDPEKAVVFDLIELKTDKKLYLLTPEVTEAIHALNEREAQMMIKTVKARLILTVTRRGDPMLWRVNLSDSDNSWLKSAQAAADVAKTVWIKLVSNVPAGRYDWVSSPKSANIKPSWPKESYEELLLKAFDGRIIDSMDHEVIVELLGG